MTENTKTPQQSEDVQITLTAAEARTVVLALMYVGTKAHEENNHAAEHEANGLAARIAAQADPERWAFANALVDVLEAVAK